MRVELAASVLLGLGQVGYIPIAFDRDVLVANDKGYLLGVDRFVAGPGEAQSWSWSSDGGSLAVAFMPLNDAERLNALKGQAVPKAASIIVYDVSRNSTHTLNGQEKGAMTQLHGWLPKTRTLLFSVTRTLPSGPQRDEPEQEWSLYRWTPGGGNAQVVDTSVEMASVVISTKQPAAVVQSYSIDREAKLVTPSFKVVGPSGAPIRVEKLGPRSSLTVNSKGDFYFVEFKINPGPPRTATESYFELLPSGQLRPVQGTPTDIHLPGQREPADPNGLQLIQSNTEAKHAGGQTRIQSIWMWMPEKGKIKATLVAPEAIRAELAPTKDAVVYATRDNVFIRRIDVLDRAGLEAIQESAERKELMNRAKQVGTAMMIYSTDCDDRLPLNKDWQEALMPYVRNRQLVDGFVYELNGDDQSKMENPAEKRLGYLAGRYGRAVVYGDSHVRWEKRRQP